MLSIKNLTKIYKIKGNNDTVALDKVNIEFPEKGMVFLLGKSGSGKSTLLNLIGGLDFPTDGEIILKGRSSKDFSQSDFDSYRNTYIGFIFQEYNILNEFNVEQNIALAIELQGKKVTKEAVDNLLAQVDLVGFGKRKPNTLSGGQKQRIAIARALIKEPNIIMADEPTGALDSKTGEQVFETLKKLSSDKLVIVVSHDRDFAERFGDRIIELKDGRILSDQTKHMVESTVISDNVTIINDHAIKINDAKKLTKKDFDQLYESIKNSDGKVFISSGENADKSMKVARISEDGRSDEFKETGEIELKQYDASQTTFIRSKMPISKSTKMGLSSLKTKPVRLVFTMLLSVISFTMFGVASALMLYNPNHTYSEALRRTDYKAEVVQKYAVVKETHQTLNAKDEVIDEWSYKYDQEAKYGVNEIKELNKNSLGLVYIPVCRVYSIPYFNGYTMDKNSGFYNQYYRLTYLSDVSKEEFNRLGYRLEGNYPTKDDEIILPKTFGDMLIDSGAIKKNSYVEAIGANITFNGQMSTPEKLTITGFFDAGDVSQEYMQLADEESKLSPQEKTQLSEDLTQYFANSFNSVGFVTPGAYDKYTDSSSRNYRSVNTLYRGGLYLSETDEQPMNVSEYYESFYTDKIINNNRNYFTFYNTNGEEVIDFALKDDEIYLPERRFEEFAYSVRDSFFNDFIMLNTNDGMMKYMPTYYAYINNPENESTIENYKMYSYAFKDSIRTFLTPYVDEFIKAYKIVTFLNQYMTTDSYQNLSNSQKELIESVRNSPNVFATQEQVDETYQILYDNFDAACPNYITNNYLETTYSFNDRLRMVIDEDVTLRDAMNSHAGDWSNATAEYVQNFLNENCKDGIVPTYRYWIYYLSGYTFKEFNPANNILKVRSDLTYNYYSFNGSSGKLKVIGYYICESDSWTLLVNENFLYANSTSNNNMETTSRLITETEYEEPVDAKYPSVMVKTEYTQEQVEFMLNCKAKGAKYTFTSDRYRNVNFIVEMISVLKNVFFWTGVGFGVFAALMMLNFITVSIAGKKKDIGILRAIGARKSDVFKIFFSESLFIASVCALLALIFSFMTIFFLDNYFVKEIGVSILQFSLVTVGLVIAVALVISVIATIIPVLHSSKKPPVESIRAL